jgi:hypothetical protein
MIDQFIALPIALQVLAIAGMAFMVSLVVALFVGARLERISEDYGPALVRHDGSLKWPSEQQREAARRPLVTGASRALYGWERETRRAGANTSDAALRQANACRHPRGVTNVTRTARGNQ